MATEAQICAIGILTILIALYAMIYAIRYTQYAIRTIMQNKPNLLDTQMPVSSVKTMNYEQITMNNANKYKPNQSQFLYRSFCLLFIIASPLLAFARKQGG